MRQINTTLTSIRLLSAGKALIILKKEKILASFRVLLIEGKDSLLEWRKNVKINPNSPWQ